MIKGFAIIPPVLGAIRIGKAIVKQDRKLPQKDDAFTITTQVKDKNGWIAHRLHDEVATLNPPAHTGAQVKIRSIPVKLAFDDPALNLHAEYSVFDAKSGRPLCAGDGEKARRRSGSVVEDVDCPGPEGCAFGKERNCRLFARLNVQIDGQGDDLGVFVFRTTSFNSVRTLAARMSYIRALTGGALAGMPFSLRLRAKTSANTFKSVVYFVDLVPRDGLTLSQAIVEMRQARAQWEEQGMNRAVFEATVREGLSQSAFVDCEDDGAELLDSITEPPAASRQEGSGPSFSVDEDGVVIEAPVPPARSAPVGLAGLRMTMGQASSRQESDGAPSGPENWAVELVD